VNRALLRLLAKDLSDAINDALRSRRPTVIHGGIDMADNPQPSIPTFRPTPPQPHPATGAPEQNPRRIGPATGNPQK
jgi:hypothetical protein